MKITAFDIKGTLARFETLLRKFQNMNLEDRVQRQYEEPPFKKCKISILEGEAPNPFYTMLPAAEPNTLIIPSLKSDPFLNSKYTNENDHELKKHSPKRARTRSLSHLKNANQNHRFHAKNKTLGPSSTTPTERMLSPSLCASELECFFSSCVSFHRASKLSWSDDIDWMVKTITRHGNVLKIQNRWGQPGPKQKWNGAMVTYSTPGDCHQVLKRLHIDGFTGLTPVFIPDHLKLVGRLEERLLAAHPGQYPNGSTVVIFGDNTHPHNAKKLCQMADHYGDVLSYVCVDDTVWKVTYQYTVQAVAAVLALDGKSTSRGRLRAVLEMGEKERRLNLMAAGHC